MRDVIEITQKCKQLQSTFGVHIAKAWHSIIAGTKCWSNTYDPPILFVSSHITFLLPLDLPSPFWISTGVPPSSHTNPSHVWPFGKVLVQRLLCSKDHTLDLLCREREFCWTYHRHNSVWYAQLFLVLTPPAWSIIAGIIIVLFFQCMGTLLNPINHTRGGTKLGFMAYTAAMFLLATINTAINLDIQSISYVNYWDFPGVPNSLGPGPVEYQSFW